MFDAPATGIKSQMFATQRQGGVRSCDRSPFLSSGYSRLNNSNSPGIGLAAPPHPIGSTSQLRTAVHTLLVVLNQIGSGLAQLCKWGSGAGLCVHTLWVTPISYQTPPGNSYILSTHTTSAHILGGRNLSSHVRLLTLLAFVADFGSRFCS